MNGSTSRTSINDILKNVQKLTHRVAKEKPKQLGHDQGKLSNTKC